MLPPEIVYFPKCTIWMQYTRLGALSQMSNADAARCRESEMLNAVADQG